MKDLYLNTNRTLDKVGLSVSSLLGFTLLFFAPWYINDEFFLRIMVAAVVNGILAMGFDLTHGFIEIANWGYAALTGLGGYVSALLLINLGITPWVGMIIAGTVCASMGALIGYLTLKMNAIYTSVVSWFMGLGLMSLVRAAEPITRGSNGLSVPLLFDSPWAKPYFLVAVIIAVVVYAVFHLIVKSHYGLAFKALGQDIEAAKTSGVSPIKYKLMNFTVSCFAAGFVAFYAHFVGVLTPDRLANKNLTIILVATFLGGRGSLWGPFVMALILVPILEYMNSLMELKYILYGLLLIAVMIYYPGGLKQLCHTIFGKIRHRH
jgi:branched-chain amino acid transport system permease protein